MNFFSCLYFWQATNQIASRFIFLQYNKTIENNVETVGMLCVFVFFNCFVCVCVSVSVCLCLCVCVIHTSSHSSLLLVSRLYSHTDPTSSRIDKKPIPITMYEYGFGDLYNMVFYSLIWIIIHALIHEYIWEVS